MSGTFSGLCGNFNGKTEDDFRRNDLGMADNALQFGKSWTDASSACELTAEDACQQNPDREAWAQKGEQHFFDTHLLIFLELLIQVNML